MQASQRASSRAEVQSVLVGSMKPPPSVSREATQSFCAAPDTRALFAVLGVVTHEKSGFRQSIRRAWLPSPVAGVVTRLVMRGFNASAAVIDEAAQFGDIIFLPSSASLSEYVGPLQSTWQWLECASFAWPRAALIGKAADDVWVHLPGVLESLRAGSEALGKFNLRSLYWGMIETCNAHTHPNPYPYPGCNSTCRARLHYISALELTACAPVQIPGMRHINDPSASGVYASPLQRSQPAPPRSTLSLTRTHHRSGNFQAVGGRALCRRE